MARKTTKTVAKRGSVAIYGTHAVGYGYIAEAEGTEPFAARSSGDGEPAKDRSATSALWLGIKDLREKFGVTGEIVASYDFTGDSSALATIPPGAMPCFGDLKWTREGTVVIASTTIVAAAR